MRWRLRWGSREALLHEIEAQTGSRPQGLVDKPVLRSEARWVWDAYRVLHISRQNDQGVPMPIPVSEVLAYTQLVDVGSASRRVLLLRQLKEMDLIYLEFVAEKQKTK